MHHATPGASTSATIRSFSSSRQRRRRSAPVMISIQTPAPDLNSARTSAAKIRGKVHTCQAVPAGRIQRDRHLHSIAEHGRAAWQRASGYTKRARAEAAIGRFKQVIGDGLRSRTDRRRSTEVDVAVHALNRMLVLGRPISVRIA